MLSGSFLDLGNYDQCLEAEAWGLDDNDTRVSLYNGKYCLMRLFPPMHPKRPNLRYSDKIFNYDNTTLRNSVRILNVHI